MLNPLLHKYILKHKTLHIQLTFIQNQLYKINLCHLIIKHQLHWRVSLSQITISVKVPLSMLHRLLLPFLLNLLFGDYYGIIW